MNGDRRVVWGVLAVAGGLLWALGWQPAAAVTTPTPSLTLSRSSGPASTLFQMNYRLSGVSKCPGGMVTFFWDTTAHTLAVVALGAPNCTASAPALPPTTASAPGQHTVIAQLAGQQTLTKPYTVLAPAPTPTPKSTPSPSPSPSSSAAPSPEPAAPPTPASCDTTLPQSTGADVYLEIPGVAGEATEVQHAGAIVVLSVAPASMLPPAVGTVPLAAVALTKRTDRASPVLAQAAANGTHFECVRLAVGPGQRYLYATYALHDVSVSAYAPAVAGLQSTERLSVRYATIDWEYQPRDGPQVVTGSGKLGATPNPPPVQRSDTPLGPLAIVTGLLLVGVAILVAGFWFQRAASRR